MVSNARPSACGVLESKGELSMRNAKHVLPIWPYIGAVACLFLMTLLAPFFWHNAVPSGPQAWKSPAPRAVASDTPAARVSTEPTPAFGVAASEPEASQLIAVFPAPRRFSRPVWVEPHASVGARDEMAHDKMTQDEMAHEAPVELSGFSAPRHQAVTAPPVADRIQLQRRAPEQFTIAARRRSTVPTNAKRLIAVSLEPEAPSLQPPAPRQRAESFSRTPHSWPLAGSLIEQFRALQEVEQTRAWATRAITTLDTVHRLNSLGTADLTPQLDELSRVIEDGVPLAKAASSPDLRSRIVRAGYGTIRREQVWRQVHRIATHEVAAAPRDAGQATQELLKVVRENIGDNANAVAWQKYLRLDEIQALFRDADAGTRAALARDVLARATSPKLTSTQRTLLQQPPFSDLQRELRRWVVQPIAYPGLLDDIELYESTQSADTAHRIADTYQVIRWSESADVAKLAELLAVHYRNANLRVAVRDDLLNRLLPQQSVFEEEVNENIVGAQVLGNAQGSAHMRTVLIPDPRRWRFGLEVEGEVESQTAATRGPATFFNDGYSRYQARKLFQVDHRGVLVSDSEAEANTNSQLTGFRTLFDSLPIIGWLARGIARQQHDDQTEMARWVSETRLETRMRERLDSEVQTQLEAAQTKIENKIIAPLQRLELNPNALEMRTTKDRLIARYRLASENHLGAFTPRPQAPSDSMLSVQVHETLLNNTLEQLDLAGRRTRLRQLYRDLADAFERSDLEVPDDIPENITVQFAEENPVRVDCKQGKVTLVLQIAELKNRRNSWQDFEVRAEYLPDPTHLQANLVRDGVIQLIGDRLSFGDQIALRTIFSRALSKNQPFNIISRKLAENPAIADLAVNQFVILDGWIGVALGPHRVAARTAPAAPGTTVTR